MMLNATMKIMNITMRRVVYTVVLVLVTMNLLAQTPPEAEVASIRLGKLWVGIAANAAKATFNYTTGFFPNDYDVFGSRGQDGEAYGGMGFVFAARNWRTPADTILRVAVFGPTNDYMQNGKVVEPMKNYIRYGYPTQVVDYAPVGISYPGIYDASKFDGHSFDQLVEVTTEHVFKVQVRRKIMVWSQTYNDDYVIVDVELTNINTDTLHDFYMNMFEGNGNMQLASTRTPPAAPGEFPTSLAATWLHYYGGRVGDTMRIFYEYHADNPGGAGDNMGAPAISQGGRLMYSQVTYYSILHASATPYTNTVDDVDDFQQPRVTYIGNSTRFPNPSSSDLDEYGSKNFWAVTGGLSKKYPMDTIHSFPGTLHGINNDDIGVSDYSLYHSGEKYSTNNHKRYSSFGPYTFPPGQKLHFVYASGVSGIGLRLSKEIGEKWRRNELENPPGMPDPEKGWLNANFTFPPSATEMDKRKDRWISMGIDSAFRSASRAKWNYKHNYNIPQSPPPPQTLSVTGHGDGVEIRWSDPAAEAMPNFAGYRIMRRLGQFDTSYYQEIYSSGSSDLGGEHVYKDTTARVGAQYYYYVQSKALIANDDPNADPTTRGKIMYSSRVLVPDVSKVIPRFPFQFDLSKIRVVPNPYNISDPKALTKYGWNSTAGYGLLFINLPPEVWIRIYTENGDLVKEQYFAEAVKNGLWFWDMISKNQQVINTGIYIAMFETPGGEIGYQKFVVVR